MVVDLFFCWARAGSGLDGEEVVKKHILGLLSVVRSRLIGTMKNGPITAPGKPTADFRACDAQNSQSREFADFRWHFTFIIGRVHRERRGKVVRKQ